VEIEEPTRQSQRQNAVDYAYNTATGLRSSFTSGKDATATTTRKETYESQVWGLVYSLQPSDEARLDRNEGVPFAYAKEMMGCDFWPVNNNHHGHEDHEDQSSMPAHVTGKKPEKRDMLVYINRNAVTPSKPKEEYVYRMNMGIRDAVKEGVPEGYVREVMRRFIPEVKGEEEVR
jgi:gamma-glutamylcyclotransferase